MKKLTLFLVLSTALSTHARTGSKIYLDNNFNKVSEQDVINGLIKNPGAVYYKLVEVTIKQKTMVATKKEK